MGRPVSLKTCEIPTDMIQVVFNSTALMAVLDRRLTSFGLGHDIEMVTVTAAGADAHGHQLEQTRKLCRMRFGPC